MKPVTDPTVNAEVYLIWLLTAIQKWAEYILQKPFELPDSNCRRKVDLAQMIKVRVGSD